MTFSNEKLKYQEITKGRLIEVSFILRSKLREANVLHENSCYTKGCFTFLLFCSYVIKII